MKKIQDNESIKPYITLIKAIEKSCQILSKIPFIYQISPKLKNHLNQSLTLVQDSKILTLPDQFNELFSKDGWICYGALSAEILERTVQLGQDRKISEAHQILIDSIDSTTINLIISRCECSKYFDLRVDLLQLLKIDYIEKRYHACIPLLLALIDGLAQDISKHVVFFAEKSNLELYDSITCHESGLPFLKTIMNQSRTTTTNEKISIPYRNGILHGRDLNFSNKEVASKCWWALACLLEWADEKSENKQPSKQLSLKETLDKYQDTQKYSQRINNWEKRPALPEAFWKSQKLEYLDPNYPEYTLYFFLNAWKGSQWGKMTPLLLHNIGTHVGKATRDVKYNYEKHKLLNFYIINSKDETPSNTTILTHLELIKDNVQKTLLIDISLNYADSQNGSSELRNESNGSWYILQSSLSDLIFY